MKALTCVFAAIKRLGDARVAAFFFLLASATFPGTIALAAESSCAGIHVEVLNIKNNTGKIDCALFASPAGFPYEALRSAINLVALKIGDSQATCDFEDIPPGTYALAVIHDENVNGKLDTNKLGSPKEGFGFSNSAKASLLRPPSYSDASFRYEGGVLDLTVTLQYR